MLLRSEPHYGLDALGIVFIMKISFRSYIFVSNVFSFIMNKTKQLNYY